MKNNNVLEYGDIPQLAMDAMNDVHREELEIVNSIHSTLAEGNEIKTNQLCKQWLEHTKAHFDRENLMMEKHGFPEYHCHYAEHLEAFQQLESIILEWNDKHDFEKLTDYVSDIWPKWYVNHTSTMDVVTSAFIKQSMLNE